MEYVVALAEEEQFTRAAALCGVSQSGLSAAIRALEDELGTRLFARTTRRVAPTEAGLALLPYARAVLDQAAAGRDAVVRATHELSGTLRLGAEQCLGVVDVPPLLERFRRRYPQVDIAFTQAGSHELVAAVRSGDLDVAFVATQEHLTGVRPVELGRREVVLLCPPGHPLSAASKVDWEALSGHDFIDFQPSWGVRSLNDAVCAARGVARHVRCTVNDIHTLLDLVDRGLGIALVPQHVAAKPQAAGLVPVRLPQQAWWVVSAVVGPAPGLAPRLLELLDADEDVAAAVAQRGTARGPGERATTATAAAVAVAAAPGQG
ncbi:LysR family transcriptional regulator [Cellulomonas sp. C5510]|nr:LysR family transcriptional regulator [Cellulomonas sp. C5510]